VQLFKVETTTDEYYDDWEVTFHWFFAEARKRRRPYARLIAGYDPTAENSKLAEGYIDELFSAVEAAAVKRYMDCKHGHDSVTTIKPVKLPISNNEIGFGKMAIGCGDEFYLLSEEAGDCLPFKVTGWYCAPVDESDVIVCDVCMQMNAEAADDEPL
jgi:hypothetical protein